MQKIIGLVGYVNKTEYIINLAKVLSLTEKKVLVIDATIEERARYSIPAFNNTEPQYLSHFDGIDFAIGFRSIKEIKDYVYSRILKEEIYDVILIDIDSIRAYSDFVKENFSKIYFFVEYSNISLAKDEELLKTIIYYASVDKKPLLTKVTFKQYVTRTSEQYFENKIRNFPVEWAENEYELPYMDQDVIADIEGEQSGYMDINRHTRPFVSAVTDMAAEIAEDVQAGDIRRIVKMYTRRKR